MMNTVELFSGAGGLALGLEAVGCRHAALIEWDKNACMTLRRAFAPACVFAGDVRDVDWSHWSGLGIDLVAGGPPCQPFSLGGKHQAHDDARDMFPYAIRAIEQLAPKAFIFENVKGLLRPSFADYFDYIVLRLTYPSLHPKAGDDWRAHLQGLRQVNASAYTGVHYKVQYALLNAADYGVPQTRERVFLVGLRSDVESNWSFPPSTHSQNRLLWEMYVTGEYWAKHKLSPRTDQPHHATLAAQAQTLIHQCGLFEPTEQPWQTVRDVLGDLPHPQTAHGIPDHVFRAGARSYPGHTGSCIDWPAKTIKAGGHGVPGGENMIRYPDGQVRYFTVLEAKRLQTFPDDYPIAGAWGEAMRQLGNAVPVRLATVLGQHLVKHFERGAGRKRTKPTFGTHQKNQISMLIPPTETVPVLY